MTFLPRSWSDSNTDDSKARMQIAIVHCIFLRTETTEHGGVGILLWRQTCLMTTTALSRGSETTSRSTSAMPGFGFFKRRTQYNASNSLQPSSDPLGSSTLGATWAVAQQSRKKGAGILFFAYGAEVTLQHFLREAAMAAASFRAVDASINIAVVTNNATVDKKLFDLHIVPRISAHDAIRNQKATCCFAGDPGHPVI